MIDITRIFFVVVVVFCLLFFVWGGGESREFLYFC